MRGMRYLLPGLLLLLAVACGGGDDDAIAEIVPTVAPTAVTNFDSGVIPVADLSSVQFELISDAPVRAFPPELEPESEPLSADQVVEFWTEFIGGTQQLDNTILAATWEACSDGTGTFLREAAGAVWKAGQRMEWWVEKNSTGRWNEARLMIRLPDAKAGAASLSAGVILNPLQRVDGKLIGLGGDPSGPAGEAGGVLIESPNCD